MKKLVTMACALVAGMALAQGVTSANTVGYTTKTIAADTFYLYGIQFEEVGNGTGAIKLDNLVSMSGIQACGYSSMEANAAQIQFLSGNSYIPYYYINDAYDSNSKEVTGWADANGDLAENNVNIGKGFWFKAPAAAISGTATLTLNGQVSGNSSGAVTFVADTFVLAANPFPVAVDLGDVAVSGITAVGYSSMESNAAQIQILNGNSYTPYYYINDAYDSNSKEVTGWADANGDLVEGDAIPVGAGFWVKSPMNGSITFSL